MNTADDIQVVTFLVGPQEFAFDILQIERILRYEPPARLPQSPEFLEGMVQYGGGAWTCASASSSRRRSGRRPAS